MTRKPPIAGLMRVWPSDHRYAGSGRSCPFRGAVPCLPRRIGVSLDAENGRLKTRGWVGDTPYTVDDVVPRLAEDGAAFLVYTDIERDGMQTGVNVPALTHLAQTSKVPVIAAGGVATLDDVKALYPLSVSANLEGAISGRAIYEGTLDLRGGHGLDRRAGAVVLTWGKGRASHGSPSLAPRPPTLPLPRLLALSDPCSERC